MRSNASNLLYLLIQTWDEALAITAKAWAKRCIFDHNIYLKDASRMHPIFLSVGENIWTAYPPSQFNTAKAIKRWVDEVKDYSYQKNSCNKVCGHYTQVCDLSTASIMWRKKREKSEPWFLYFSACDTLTSLVFAGCVGQHLQSWMCSTAVPRWHQALH